MKREYESPDFEVVHFDSNDVIRTSGEGEGGSSASSSNSFSGNVFNFF